MAAPKDDNEWLAPVVREACAEAVREELKTGLGTIRQIVREELDRDSDEEGDDSESDESDEGDGEDAWKLIICVRHDLSMSVGKVAAQVGHAVHYAVTNCRWRDLQAWERCGSKKVSVKIDSEDQLFELKRQAEAKGIQAHDIQDAGHTEVAPGTTTVLALGPALARRLDAITGDLRPLPDRAQQFERESKKLRERAERLQKELDAAKRDKKKLIAVLNAYRAHL
eukprot:TRINITY_DN66979_c0_g1_i1.p1 TRINITY_DN66979_c0_g1~~TRINITY_DN66979_c0_g1_i1.p1  ORF type:complete len:234 (+),score=60.97 TRINITY_DN66979_c0_g1_i1:29-703(+)